jgi:hypothetical protein
MWVAGTYRTRLGVPRAVLAVDYVPAERDFLFGNKPIRR